MRRILVVLALAALVAACSDQTTAPQGAGSPDFGLNNLNGYTKVWEAFIPAEAAWGGYYIPCLNNGQGEEVVTYGGVYEYWAKVVVTPTGRQNENGYIRIVPPPADGSMGTVFGDVFEGVTSHEVWIATHYESKLGYKYFVDGRTMITQPISAIYTNQADPSRHMYVRSEWHWITDAAGNFVAGNPRTVSPVQCRLID